MPEIVSVIITVLNGEKWIDSCFSSICKQTILTDKKKPVLEVCVFDDSSTDNTLQLLRSWRHGFKELRVPMKIIKNTSGYPKGVGYGRNSAIKRSIGDYLCFQDIDDEMLPERVETQLNMARRCKNSLIGSQFIRTPENSTCRFSKWANELPWEKLETQIFTSHGPTIIMPTWFCHRSVFKRVSKFSENGKGTPEDLLFFYKHLDVGGKVARVDKILLNYRYHQSATTFSIPEETIWRIRLKRLCRDILNSDGWKKGFTIWNAGKQGRKFFRDISDELKLSVRAFCDIDQKKINKTYQYFDEVKRKVTYAVPIIHFRDAVPPIVICVKLDLTNGVFEENLRSLRLVEGQNYVIFS